MQRNRKKACCSHSLLPPRAQEQRAKVQKDGVLTLDVAKVDSLPLLDVWWLQVNVRSDMCREGDAQVSGLNQWVDRGATH